jgi:hypothetical protein
MNSKHPIICSFLATVLLFSCSKDDTNQVVPVETKTFKNLAAAPTVNAMTSQPQAPSSKFTLFSLRTGEVIANTDSTTDKWDLGFRGTTIIVNGGAIRTGKGGLYVHTGLFDELKEVPATATFLVDETTTKLALASASGQGWYNYNAMANIISPIPGRVLVVRTGDGKFAKVEILSYYKDAPANPDQTNIARHYTFRYVVQPDGSKKLSN